MKAKRSTRVAALGSAAMFSLSLMALPGAQPMAFAAEQEIQAMISDNKGDQDYTVWSKPVCSYLYSDGNEMLSRVEYIDGNIIVEDYGRDFSLLNSRTIAMELQTFGGFYAGTDANYLIFGQGNSQESNQTEVIRVVKYSKDWVRLDYASLYGANTTLPFDSGSLRCDEYGGYLYVHTSHKMYTSDNGIRHQSNLLFSVREEDMEITDQLSEVSNSTFGYISHSFNQFILVDEQGNLVAMDHGDTFPRSLSMTQYYYPAGKDYFVNTPDKNGAPIANAPHAVTCFDILKINGSKGNNQTGAALGGLAETSSGYVAAYCDNGTGSGYQNRTVSLSYIDKAQIPKAEYQNGKLPDPNAIAKQVQTVEFSTPDSASTPQLVSTGLSGGWVIWNGMENGYTPDDTLYYASYDADGTASTVYTASAPLSDCQPIVFEDQVVWYVTDNSTPTFYTLDDAGVTAYPVEQSAQPDPTPEPEPEPEPAPTPEKDELSDPRQAATITEAALQARQLQGRASSYDGTYGIDTDGVLWRRNKTEEPTKVMDNVRQVDAKQIVAAVKQDNTLWAWGRLGALDLLPNFDDFSDTPVKVMANVRSVAADNFGLMILKTDGSLWYMGCLSQGEDGAGTSKYEEFGTYHIMDDVTMVDVGASRYVALKNDGSVWVWGADGYTGADKFISFRGDNPQPLTKILDDMICVGMQSENGWAIDQNGALWSWGLASWGQAGCGNQFDYTDPNSDMTAQTIPVKIIDQNVISAGYGIAVLKDGNWYGWGQEYGDASTPVLQSGTKVVADQMQYRVKEDGSLWSHDYSTSSDRLMLEHFFHSDQASTIPHLFSDVPANAWYATYVNTAAQAGLVQGVGAGQYAPERTLSLAEVVSLSARLYATDHGQTVPPSNAGEPWYQGAYDYAIGQGLFNAQQVPVDQLTQPANRYQMLDLLDRAVDDSQKAAINPVPNGTIPDVKESDPYGAAVYRWYRAGIAQGDETYAFHGENSITRAEVATFLCRLKNLTPRSEFDLSWVHPSV